MVELLDIKREARRFCKKRKHCIIIGKEDCPYRAHVGCMFGWQKRYVECPVCGKKVDFTHSKSNRITCSNSCRTKLYEIRKRERENGKEKPQDAV